MSKGKRFKRAYKPGACLPKQRERSEDLDVALTTDGREQDILDREGYVVGKEGQRTYVIIPETHAPIALVAIDENIRGVLRRARDYRMELPRHLVGA